MRNLEKIKGVEEMYESYPWPGAYTFKDEAKLLRKWVKELFDGILREIRKSEK